jgi:hypothetical protein
MLVKGEHRGLQLGAAALNCAARVLLEAVKFLWHIDMLAAASVCISFGSAVAGRVISGRMRNHWLKTHSDDELDVIAIQLVAYVVVTITV